MLPQTEFDGYIVGSDQPTALRTLKSVLEILSKSCLRKSERNTFPRESLLSPPPSKLVARTGSDGDASEQGGTLTEQGKKPTGPNYQSSRVLPNPQPPVAAGAGAAQVQWESGGERAPEGHLFMPWRAPEVMPKSALGRRDKPPPPTLPASQPAPGFETSASGACRACRTVEQRVEQ